MKRRATCSFGAILLAALGAGLANAAVVTFQPGDALGIDVSAHAYKPDQNYDGDGLLYLYANESSPLSQNPATSYLRFDMPSFLNDPGLAVQSATLKAHLYQVGNWGTSTATVGAAGVTQAWGETTLTWNNKPTTDATSTGSATVSGIPSGGPHSTDQWSQWDITPLVNDWVAGTRPNHGVVLRVDTPSNRAGLWYHASDLPVWQHEKPRLDIEVTGLETGALYDWEQGPSDPIHDQVGADAYLVAGSGSPGTTPFLTGTGGLFSRSTKDVLRAGTAWDELRYSGPLTLSAVIQPDASTFTTPLYDNPTIVAKYADLTPDHAERGYALYISQGGYLSMAVSEDGTSGTTQAVKQDTVTMEPGGVYHVAGVFRPGEEIELYINGKSVKAAATSLTRLHDTPAALSVGGMQWSGGTAYVNPFGGVIDEVRVMDRALSDDEVKLLSHARGPVVLYDWEGHPPGILDDKAYPVLTDLQPGISPAPQGPLSFPVDEPDFRRPGNTGGRFSRSHGSGDALRPVDAATNSDLRITDELTVTAWIQPSAITLGATGYDNPVIVAKYGEPYGPATNERGWFLGFDDGKLRFIVSPDGVTTAQVQEAAASMSPDGIYHVAAVFRPGQEMELFIDGQTVSSLTTGVPAAIHDSTVSFTLGGMWWENRYANLFDGVMDDVRVYPYAMTDAEVYSVYIPEPCTLALLGAGALLALRRRRRV